MDEVQHQMGSATISKDDVLAAMNEFDQLGRQAFLQTYGYGEARDYFLVKDNRRYDSKAVVGVAHKFRRGAALTAGKFSGGEATVGKLLRDLGFEVIRNKQLNWTRDELILVCDLVRSNAWKEVKAYDPRAHELSALLQLVSPYPVVDRGPSFRNPNSVQFKSGNIASAHPDYPKRQSRGGALDRKVIQEFLEDPVRMSAHAQALRLAVRDTTPASLVPEPDIGDLTGLEGGLLERHHIVRERDPKLRATKIRLTQDAHGQIACEACGFDFERTYGCRGKQYIECHHTVPLHSSGITKTHIKDLALLCSNCHRMIHVRRPWLTVENLREILEYEQRPCDPA